MFGQQNKSAFIVVPHLTLINTVINIVIVTAGTFEP